MNAIILAAGHGSRMITGKQFIHKPLLPILGTPNIERTIIMLKDYGIKDIIIISGIYAKYYEYLHQKYNCIIISDSTTSFSTLYGIYNIKDKIEDTFIIEGDVVLAENVFDYKPYSYYYVIKYPNCEPDAWKPITDNTGRIKSFNIGSFTSPCIFGISFWSKNDTEYLKDYINRISTPENLMNNNKFWDDYFFDILDRLPIFTHEISATSATEMNDVHEYNLAKELCIQYYSTPDQYFLNLHDFDNDFSFYINNKQAIVYAKKLLEDYNFKHSNHVEDVSGPINFNQNEYTYMVRMKEETIGFISLINEKNYLQLRRIYIDEIHRNQLLGTKLLNKLIAFSKLINKELRVNIYDENALHFYKRLGFKENFLNYVLRSE